MDRRLNIRLIVAVCAFIAFLALSLYAGIAQLWWLFLCGILLTMVSVSYALVEGEWWKSTRGDDSVRPGRS
ncbi:hypothetical protein ABZT47_33460 [Sphaerisporangium sp. NPDC005289]|uniref:DUF4175 domain-containing protein n=1 Tax=Sphaerisporangium rhizosphaerae TaxID=2269375 RepID=A0ABW2NWG4_9ACTN